MLKEYLFLKELQIELTAFENWKTTASPLGEGSFQIKPIRCSERKNRFDHVLIFNLVDGAGAVHNPLHSWNCQREPCITLTQLNASPYCSIITCKARREQRFTLALARTGRSTYKIKHVPEPFSGKLQACSVFLHQHRYFELHKWSNILRN